MKRTLTFLAVVASVVAGFASGAAAYWAARATTGSGTASVGTFGAVTLVTLSSEVASSSLVPGASADLVVKISNTNAYSVTLTGIAGNGTVTADGSHAGCTTTGVSVTTRANLTTALASGTNTIHIAGGVSMSTASVSACQGATFSVPVTITVQK